MKTYGVGIVGFGWVAGAHLNTFRDLPNYQPVAVLSRRKLDPAQIKQEHGVDVKIYNDYDKFLSDDSIDVVDICTPHPFHPEQSIRAAEAKKDLIIEKPLGLKFEDTVKMMEAVEKNKVRTNVCFELRFVSASKAMKSIVDNGLIGDIYYAEGDYFHGIGPWYGQFAWNVKKDMGGSSLLTAGLHALDMILWLIGQEPEEVFSYSAMNPNPIFKPYQYDTATVTVIRFKNGMMGKCASVIDCLQPYFFNLNILGSQGTIKNDEFFSKKIEGLNGWTKMDVHLADSGDVGAHPYRDQFAYFAECMDNGKRPHNDLASAFETHRVVFAADKSAETGKPVSLSDFSR